VVELEKNVRMMRKFISWCTICTRSWLCGILQGRQGCM